MTTFRRGAVTFAVVAFVTAQLAGQTSLLAAEGSPETSSPMLADDVLRVPVPGAEGGKTVIGQLTAARATGRGYITAYGCADGIPRDASGSISRSDLNFDGQTTPVTSNRLIVQADADGDVCLHTSGTVDMVVDISGVSFDTGISSFDNQRIDTRGGSGPVTAGNVLRLPVPGASGRKTVIGQLTAANAVGRGYITAYGCDDGLPRDGVGDASRSDLNFDGSISPVTSNRLIVQADADGDVCLYTSASTDMVVDINGTSDDGLTSFTNRRTDTRDGIGRVSAGQVLRIPVKEATGSKTVIGQLTAARATDRGYITAYGCDDGIPRDASGNVSRSDLNYNGRARPVMSNRLIVQADADGDVCLYTSRNVDLVVDINAVSGTGITAFANQRTDTRNSSTPGSRQLPTSGAGVPIWPALDLRPPLDGVAALTGFPAGPGVTNRPILAVKIDNYRLARPHAGLDQADAIIEVNAEGVSRFIALFHSQIPSTIGPVRSARTGDLDLLAAMNRPAFAYSGANFGVSQWLASAESSGVIEDFGAQQHGCFVRDPARRGPHDLMAKPACILGATSGGAAQSLWSIDDGWVAPGFVAVGADSTFSVPFGGVRVEWTWNPTTRTYLRFQDGAPHAVVTGTQLSARNVVVVETDYTPSPVDARSPHVIALGRGAATVHRDGLAIFATWTRNSPNEPFRFIDDASGATIPLGTGVTFLELIQR